MTGNYNLTVQLYTVLVCADNCCIKILGNCNNCELQGYFPMYMASLCEVGNLLKVTQPNRLSLIWASRILGKRKRERKAETGTSAGTRKILYKP